jgi:hypothetical protein
MNRRRLNRVFFRISLAPFEPRVRKKAGTTLVPENEISSLIVARTIEFTHLNTINTIVPALFYFL